MTAGSATGARASTWCFRGGADLTGDIAQRGILQPRADFHERVRVDRRPDGVVLASQAELQDKSDRYYFRETIVRRAPDDPEARAPCDPTGDPRDRCSGQDGGL